MQNASQMPAASIRAPLRVSWPDSQRIPIRSTNHFMLLSAGGDRLGQ